MNLSKKILVFVIFVFISSPLMAGGQSVPDSEISRQDEELGWVVKRLGLSEETVFASRDLISNALYNKGLDSLTIGLGHEIKYKLLGVAAIANYFINGDPSAAFLATDARNSDEEKIVQQFYWIDNVYLQSLNGTETIVPDKLDQNYCITVADINMRYGPSENNDIIKVLSKYTKVRIVDKNPKNGWVKIKDGNDEGFVSGRFLNFAAVK